MLGCSRFRNCAGIAWPLVACTCCVPSAESRGPVYGTAAPPPDTSAWEEVARPSGTVLSTRLESSGACSVPTALQTALPAVRGRLSGHDIVLTIVHVMAARGFGAKASEQSGQILVELESGPAGQRCYHALETLVLTDVPAGAYAVQVVPAGDEPGAPEYSLLIVDNVRIVP